MYCVPDQTMNKLRSSMVVPSLAACKRTEDKRVLKSFNFWIVLFLLFNELISHGVQPFSSTVDIIKEDWTEIIPESDLCYSLVMLQPEKKVCSTGHLLKKEANVRRSSPDSVQIEEQPDHKTGDTEDNVECFTMIVQVVQNCGGCKYFLRGNQGGTRNTFMPSGLHEEEPKVSRLLIMFLSGVKQLSLASGHQQTTHWSRQKADKRRTRIKHHGGALERNSL